MTSRVPAWSLAVAAMLSVQIGAAYSTRLFDEVGPGGTAWLRLTFGGAIFLLLSRPKVRGLTWREWRTPIALGIATGVLTVAFLSAVDRIPLGTTVAIEFLGPLSVAVLRSSDRRTLVWPALALAGVLLLTEPWQGSVDAVGVAFACLSGLSWATYIVLTQRVGDRFAGLDGLSLTIPVAAVTSAFVGVPQAWGHLSLPVLAAAAGLALLLPVIPFSLELLALRRLTTAAFGTLMALEPGISLVIGLVVLSQVPGPLQLVGVGLVVAAGVGAERTGHRDVAESHELTVPPGAA